MKYKKAQLVLGDLGDIRGLSIRYLSSYTKANGIETNLLFPLISARGFNNLPRLTEIQMELVLKFLKEKQATHFGCYLMTGHFRAFKNLVVYLRESGWKGCIIAGGIHATSCPKETLFPGIDYIVIGPGEKPLVSIVRGEPIETINGLGYMTNGEMKFNKESLDNYQDLDLLPFPDYDFIDHFIIRDNSIEQMNTTLFQELSPWNGTYYYLTTTRGCPYECTYCCNINRRKFRRASVDKVMEELHHAKKKLPFLHGVNIQDDSFFMGSDEWLLEFCARFKAEFSWPFIARIMPKFVTEKRLQVLKNGGLKYVSIGLQGSERMNRELYKRSETNKSFINACHLMAKMGIIYVVDVIMEVVYETEDDLREIARTVNQIPRPFKVLAYNMTPFPGSPFYDRVVKDGLLKKFGTDAYESMFIATRPGSYKTPLYWRRLIKDIIPLYRSSIIDDLIESDPHDKKAASQVDKLYKKASRKMRLIEMVRQRSPKLLDRAISVYNFMRNNINKLSSLRKAFLSLF